MKMVRGLLSLIPSVNLSSLQHQKMIQMMIPFFLAKLKSISFIRHLCPPSSTKRPLPSAMSAPPPRKLRKLVSHSLKECAKSQPQPAQPIQDDSTDAHDKNGSNRFDSGNFVMGTKDALRRVFAFIDEDCDGRLSLDEIQVFLNKKMDISISPEELQALILYNNSEVDKLGSSPSSSFMDLGLFESILMGGSGILGHVQKEEEKEKEEEEEEEDVKGSFCVFDVDGDGFISAKELHSCLTRMGFKHEMEACEAIINALDLDGNGLLDFSEFNKMMNSLKGPPPPFSSSSSSSSSFSASSSSSSKM